MLLTGALALLAAPFFAQAPAGDTAAADSMDFQVSPGVVMADSVVTDTTITDPTGTGGDLISTIKKAWDWLLANWGWALTGFLALWEFIARLTPSDKDNNLLRLVQSWLDRILPNRKKGGGSFAAFREEDDAPKLAYVKKR